MSPILTVLAASVTTFAATNVDDMFLLTVFFARRIPTRRMVVGPYLGFAAIVAVTFAAVWMAGLAVPRAWVQLLGILPIAIGIEELLQAQKARRMGIAFTENIVFSPLDNLKRLQELLVFRL
jgi:cadmium resistance protein CadD (predicted permease)